MNTEQIIAGAVAVVVVCAIIITRAILVRLGKGDAVANMDKYLPYAVMAAKYVEEKIPDNYGAGAEDPTTAKAAHKLDLFLRKFSENVEKFTGDKATEEMIDAAKGWAATLAERVGK